MRQIFLGFLVVLALATTAEAGKKATFDVLTYEVPAGWKEDTSKGALTLQASDGKKQTFVLVIAAPSTPSAGSLAKDFQATWDAAVVPSFSVTGAPEMSTGTPQNGWEITAGATQGTANGVPAVVMLVTATGHGKTISLIVTTNSDTYTPVLEKLVASMKLAVPASALPGTPPPPPSKSPPSPPPPATTGARVKGVSAATTTFADGWTSTIEADWVRASREGGTVYLHYPIAFDDELRRDTIGVIWARLVAPRYQISNVYAKSYSALNFPYYFQQADAIDRATGKPVFLTVLVIAVNGLAYPIEAAASTRAQYEQWFPDPDKFATIANANRFAIGSDLVGTWSSSSGAGVNMYYTGTGNYAGMNAAVTSSTFVFSAKGTFTGEHKGATGMVGSMTTYQTKEKGTFTASPWELVLSRSDGKRSTYDAYYEAARGGAVLHLRDKQYSGHTYTLLRQN